MLAELAPWMRDGEAPGGGDRLPELRASLLLRWLLGGPGANSGQEGEEEEEGGQRGAGLGGAVWRWALRNWHLNATLSSRLSLAVLLGTAAGAGLQLAGERAAEEAGGSAAAAQWRSEAREAAQLLLTAAERLAPGGRLAGLKRAEEEAGGAAEVALRCAVGAARQALAGAGPAA